MISAILKGIFSIIMKLVNVLLMPINLIISKFLPGIDNVLTNIRAFINLIFQYVGFIMDSLCISSETISFMILVFTFMLTAPLLVSSIKLVINWYNNLKV